MSLENAIETLIVKIEALTQITSDLASLRADAIQTVQKEAAPAPKRAAAKKEEVKPEPEAPEAEVQEVPATEEPDAPKADTLSDAVKEFVALAGDVKEKRTEITNIVKGIFAKVKATKRSEVPAEKEAAVEKAIRAEIAKFEQQDETAEDDLL